MKVALLTDTHFGARSDSPTFQAYFDRFYNEIFFPYLADSGINKVLHLGDFTDRRKYVNYYTLSHIRKGFINNLNKFAIEMIVILGNHDCYFKNTNEVNSIQELFSVVPEITILTEPGEIYFEGTKALLLPWINETNHEQSFAAIKNTDAKVLMAHLELKGFIMQRGQKAENGFDADLFQKFDLVCSGHYHHKSSEGNIHYLGAPYEMTFADINDPRGFHVWDTETNELEFIQNPYRMFHKLFYDDKEKELGTLLKKLTERYTGTYVKVIVQNRTNPYYFEKYLEKLFSLNPADVKIEEDFSLTEGDEEATVDMAEDTLTILNKYVDDLEIDADKTKVKEELRLLYIEASNMEK